MLPAWSYEGGPSEWRIVQLPTRFRRLGMCNWSYIYLQNHFDSGISSTVPTTKTSGRIVTCNFQPVEFASDQEAVKILHQWSSQHPNNPYPGTRRRGNARLNPPKVIFQDMVVQVTQFTVTKDRASTMRDRVGWLLPCKNGKYLFVKPLAGLYNRGALVAWIGGTNGLGTEVIARLCHSPCTAPPRFPKRIYTASWQSDHTQRMNSLIPINKGLRSLSSRVVRSAREAEAQRSKEDSVDFSTAYEGSSDADHGSTTRTYTPARNDRRVSVMIPARRNVREDSASSFSDMASTAENYPNATDLRSYTRKPITALTTSADQSPQHPTPVSIKRRSSQSFDATQNSSSKRIALDHTNVIFHFIVPLPEGEGPLPDSKPDSIPLDLSECDGSDRFFACAKMAWEMGTSSTGALRGVRCGWDGAKRKSIIPWGNSEIYKSFVGVIRSAKVPEVGERLDVDVDCMVWWVFIWGGFIGWDGKRWMMLICHAHNISTQKP